MDDAFLGGSVQVLYSNLKCCFGCITVAGDYRIVKFGGIQYIRDTSVFRFPRLVTSCEVLLKTSFLYYSQVTGLCLRIALLEVWF